MSRPTKILVAYDGSAQSMKALDWAIDLSVLSNAPVIAVKVVEPMETGQIYALYETGYVEALNEWVTEMRQKNEKFMQDVAERGRKSGIEIKTELLHGNIAGVIIDYAKQNGVDLIVAGTTGHGILGEILIGSVTHNLLSLSHIPVFVVK
jgi:nucleotide-binding universal stress UspA family protein